MVLVGYGSNGLWIEGMAGRCGVDGLSFWSQEVSILRDYYL